MQWRHLANDKNTDIWNDGGYEFGRPRRWDTLPESLIHIYLIRTATFNHNHDIYNYLVQIVFFCDITLLFETYRPQFVTLTTWDITSIILYFVFSPWKKLLSQTPVFNLTFPCPIHLHSLMPMTFILYLSIYLASWAGFPIEYNLHTFQHPIFTWTFSLVNDVVSLRTSVWLWSGSVMLFK